MVFLGLKCPQQNFSSPSSSSTVPSLLPLSTSGRARRSRGIVGWQGSRFLSPWYSSSSSSVKCHCFHENGRGDVTSSSSSSFSSPYDVLGIDPSSSFPEIKSAFRRKVKEFHPDVCKNLKESDIMIQRVIKAYQEKFLKRIMRKDRGIMFSCTQFYKMHMKRAHNALEMWDELLILLCKNHECEVTEREDFDPFEEPECEASDVFINETICIGKGCPYSCVKTAPNVFSFNPDTGTARVNSQGSSEDYKVQLAIGQCPRRCIHYVTPSQKVILEEVLYSILNAPYDPAEIACLEALIAKATFENNRYQPPKKQPKSKTEFVDWY